MPSIDPLALAIAFTVLILSLSVHEAAHAWSALKLGDSTAKRLGRVSLNPLVHIDLIGTVVFPLVAMTTGFPVLGWAKPVPVSPPNLGANWRQKFMVIAAAGPASNLVLALGAAIGVRLVLGVWDQDVPDGVERFVYQMLTINVVLAVFNMLPIPPLDGGNVLAGLLPERGAALIDLLRPYGFILLYVLLFTGVFGQVVFPIAESVRISLLRTSSWFF